MDLTSLLDRHGTGPVLAAGGAVIGALFGFFAQRSRFCLRAAVIEFWHGKFAEKLSVWLLAFASAVIAVQALILSGLLDVSGARQLANRGSLSGALVGGLLFGAGMIMTRGCASRLLVLSANGNLRALLSGLVFAVTAQAALAGSLSPLRAEIASWWTIEGNPPSRSMLSENRSESTSTTGSPRDAHELGLPGLRSWALKRYPYLVFYVERTDHVDVWRVLHEDRDIPAWMRDSLAG